jgi:hypothetical protein
MNTRTGISEMERMPRSEIVLAALAAAGGAALTPVQVQKLFFLADENISQYVGGKYFQFEPRDYGPFDSSVYREIDALRIDNLAEMEELGFAPRRQYRLTPEGQARGERILGFMPPEASDYLRRLVSWIRNQTFEQLVTAIYRQYPDMKANSVFREH